MTGSPPRRELKLVHQAEAPPAEWSWFCGHCAAPSPGGEAPAPTARVCPACGLGLLLETRADVAPTPLEAFLVVDTALTVQAMSIRAELLLGLDEDLALNKPVSELLVPADAESQRQVGFAAAVADAVARSNEPARAYVRPWNTFGVRLRARIAPCGPPRAAVVVLEAAADHLVRAVE